MFASIAATPFANFSALGGRLLFVVRAAGRLYWYILKNKK